MGRVVALEQWRSRNGRNGRSLSFRDLARMIVARGHDVTHVTLANIEQGVWYPSLPLAVVIETITDGQVCPRDFVIRDQPAVAAGCDRGVVEDEGDGKHAKASRPVRRSASRKGGQ